MHGKHIVLLCLCFGILLAAGLFAQTENLTHSWTFNDGTTNDYVGGLKGTLMGNASVTEGVLWISDLDQWMEMPGDSIALNTYDEITLEI